MKFKFKRRIHYFFRGGWVGGWCGRMENKAMSAFNSVEAEVEVEADFSNGQMKKSKPITYEPSLVY